jgi:ATP-dependent Lon protease
MGTADLDHKILDTFKEFAIDKGLITRLGLSRDDRHIPSYVMDWIVTFAVTKVGTNTSRLRDAVVEFIKKHLPSKGEKESIKFRLSQGETLTILDALSVEVKLGNPPEYLASIPCIDEKKARIEAPLLRQNEGLLQSSIWGAAKICHDDSSEHGGVRVIDFKPMQIGRISLDAFRECRQAFSAEEWVDLLVRTMGYEPGEYSEEEKLWLLCRVIPIVQNRVNMMELAPPGSGKSFVYNNISRHVWLTASQISAPVLFYNRQTHTPGLLTRYDLLVLDEAQSLQFSNPSEIQAQLKGYLEQGVYARGDCAATAECGLMLLANIDIQPSPRGRYRNGKPAFEPRRGDYIRRLPNFLLESPLVDRFHGILPGWKIPPFETTQQAQGYGLKADYFSEVCHALRSASDIAQAVRARLRLSGGKRDCTAIERLACGLAKLLLIGPDDPHFDELVVRPAEEMRRNVRSQLHALDPDGYVSDLTCTRLGTTSIPSQVLDRFAHYDLLEEIGHGGFARVYKGIDTRSGTIVAVKMATTDGKPDDERAIRREMDIYERLKQIPNAHILAVRDIFRGDGRYALVTEYADGGSLWDLTEGPSPEAPRVAMDEATVKQISLAILDGLCTLHENDIVHRDIKPENILRCDDNWKIADFGISKLRSSPVTGFTLQGAHSMPWAPPEQRDGAAAHPSADIYAVGRVMAFLLTGSVKAEDYASLPSSWWKIIKPCLSVIPDERPDAQQLRTQVTMIAAESPAG